MLVHGIGSQCPGRETCGEPSGRILMDGAALGSNDETLNEKAEGGFAVPDVRLGVSATYGKWKAKVDVGYSRQTLAGRVFKKDMHDFETILNTLPYRVRLRQTVKT